MQMQAETLTGDIRDMILTHIRAMETPWSKLSEKQQREKIEAATKAADNAVRGAVRIVADKGFPHLIVSTGKWTVKDGIKLEVIAAGTVENVTHLAEHDGGSAVLVLCDVKAFFGQREEAKPAPDQPDLPIEGEVEDAVEEVDGADVESYDERFTVPALPAPDDRPPA
jgi:hypothetical protein